MLGTECAIAAVPHVHRRLSPSHAGHLLLSLPQHLPLWLLHSSLLLLTVLASSCGRLTTPVSQNRHDSPMPIRNCSSNKHVAGRQCDKCANIGCRHMRPWLSM